MARSLAKWVVAIGYFCFPALAFAGGGFHLPIGFTYVSGLTNVDHKLKDAVEQQGGSYDSFVWPVGLSLQPYYEFDNGIGIGGSIGPVTVGSVQTFGGTNSFFSIIPLGLDARYTFFRDGNISPYVRGGFRYPITLGDNVKNGKIGAFGAVGVEFFRQHSSQLGVELGYDDSTVDVSYDAVTETARPDQVMASVYWIAKF